MSSLLLVIVGALATARLTRLVTADQLTLPLRRRVLQVVREGGRLEYLASCSWCASMWIAAPVAIVVLSLCPDLQGDGPHNAAVYGLLTLAYSHVTGRLARTEVEA